MRQKSAAVAVLLAVTVFLVGLSSGLVLPVRLDAQQSAPPVPATRDARSLPAQSAAMPSPQVVTTAFMTEPQELTSSQIASSLLDFDRLSATWQGRRAAVVTATPAAGPAPGTEVVPRDQAPDATGPVARVTNRVMPAAPSVFGLAVRMIAEPAVAVGDSVMWLTGNWFAARSTDEGATWSYANPYADFPTFASDQDAAYDPHRRLFLWYRQGGLLPGRLENSFRLNVSSDGAASWCSYSLRPGDVDPAWAVNSFDYPHLALSDNYLYISSMLVAAGGGLAAPRMVLFRLPLDDLAGCSPFRFVYWTTDEGWSWTPVENGATTAMFLGDTLDPGGTEATGTFRLYMQPENTTTLYFVDRAVPAWTFTERTGLCTVLGGGNPCARSDGRITSGWAGRQQNGAGEIGFLWNVREGGGFPHPYINAVTFDQETLAVTGRPMLWDSKCAWQYGAAAPGPDGVGIAAFHFCASQPPAHAVGVADNLGRAKWTMSYSRVGDVPTSTVVWGDYIRTRAIGGGYVATGYTIGQTGAEPFLVAFGPVR